MSSARLSQESPSMLYSERDLLTGDGSIEYCLENPLCCGFLLKFCESEYNSENIRFLMAVDSFRDAILARDKTTWITPWKELDATYLDEGGEDPDVTTQPDHVWTSNRFDEKEFNRLARYIWDEFLNETSTNQIFMPGKIARNTRQRYRLRHIYGPDVFVEACIDPIKTIRRDILPRFVSSALYSFFEDHNKEDSADGLQSLSPEMLKILLPPNTRYNAKNVDSIPPDRLFELHEILDVGILFYELLLFLRSTVSSENLLCVRMIDIYEDLYDQNNNSAAVEHAWKIYKYFIAPNSLYEISLNHLDRKEIMLRMATPNQVIFEKAKKSAYHALRSKFEAFRSTSTYTGLAGTLKEKIASRHDLEAQLEKDTKLSCFGK